MVQHANRLSASKIWGRTPQEQRKAAWSKAMRFLKYGQKEQAERAFIAAELANFHAMGAPQRMKEGRL